MTFQVQKKNLSFFSQKGVELRFGHWTRANHPPKGTFIIIPGRTECLEKYHETVLDIVSRDYDSVVLEMRNHGLSTRPLANRLKHHLTDFGDMVRDLDAFIKSDHMRSLPRPLYLMGHSMGGHVVLRYLAERHDDTVKAAILSAPMVGINFGGLPRWLVGLFALLGQMPWICTRYVPGQHDWDDRNKTPSFMKLLTHDAHRFQEDIALLEENPNLALGGITFGWLHAALASIDLLQSKGYADRIKTPVLIAQGAEDRVVDNQAQNDIAARVPTVDVTVIDDAAHEILRETNAVRLNFWHKVDEFLKSHQ